MTGIHGGQCYRIIWERGFERVVIVLVKGKSFFFRSKMKEGILEKILQEIFEEEEDVVNEEGEYYCYLKF